VCCSVLECAALHCRVLQSVAQRKSPRHSISPIHCNMCVAVCCSVLQCVAVICEDIPFPPSTATCTSMSHVTSMKQPCHISLQHTATHCNTLQHTATHCNAQSYHISLQHTATHCTALQHTATHSLNTYHCNTLQHTATHCNILQRTVISHITESCHESIPAIHSHFQINQKLPPPTHTHTSKQIHKHSRSQT